MRLQLGEGAGALARTVAQDARHRQPGVVVEDGSRHAAEEGAGGIMAIKKGLGPLGRVGFDEAGVRVRQIKAENVDLAPLAADHCHRFAEVDLGMTRRVCQRHEHLQRAGTVLAHIVLHDRVAAGETMFRTEPIKDPLRCVPLLGRCGVIRLYNRINGRGKSVELGTRWRLATPVARRHRMAQHLRHRLRINAKPPRSFPLAHSLNMARMAYPCIQLHWLHPHPSGRSNRPEDKQATEFYAAAARQTGRFREGVSLRRLQICWRLGFASPM